MSIMSRINLFICYAREDKNYRENLRVYINDLEFPRMQIWYDGEIEAGKEWDEEIKKNLNQSDIILLLISQYFINSSYIRNVELKMALHRHHDKKSRVIPIFARKCNLEKHPDITKLNGFPEDMRFFSELGNEADTEYANIQKKIGIIADELAVDKDIRDSLKSQTEKGEAARQITQLQTQNRIFLALTPTAEGIQERRRFQAEAEFSARYEGWPFELVPSPAESKANTDHPTDVWLQQQMQDCLYSVHIVSHPKELSEGPGALQYAMARRQAEKNNFFRLIIWYLSEDIRKAMDPALTRELLTHPNARSNQEIFTTLASLENDRKRQLANMRKDFSETKKVFMLYNFDTDHGASLRIRLKEKIEKRPQLAFRFSLPDSALQDDKNDLAACQGAVLYYGSADTRWFVSRQALLLDATNTPYKLVCVDIPEIQEKISRDLNNNAFKTIRGDQNPEVGLDDFLNGLLPTP